MTEHRVSALQRDSQWSDLSVCVVGLGVAGYSCADVLMQLGASVTIVDESPGDIHQERAEVLGSLGAAIRFGEAAELPLDSDLVVVSPGIRPSAPVLAPALAREIPIWGELELAWRLRRGPSDAPWMCVTGTNGKTTVTLMLESMLTASGARAVSAGNIGVPLVDVIMHDDVEVIAVEVGAPQLPFVASMSPYSAVCLNIADDHIDHFGSLEEYVNSKERIYRHTLHSAIYSVDDDVTRGMVERADVIAGCRAIGFTLGVPDVGMVGVVDNLLVDRAYLEKRRDAALELASINDVRPQAPHNVANALAAAALARSYGVHPSAVRAGLRDFQPAPHRIAEVGEFSGVRYVDDSKATNTHAAKTSLLAYPSVVWVAGGVAKGQEFDDLVVEIHDRLRGVVLLGRDAGVIRDALARHAPDIPVIVVERNETGVMGEVVDAAAGLARPGDVVLLAPGCASWDMFTDYAERGRAFADAVLQQGSPS